MANINSGKQDKLKYKTIRLPCTLDTPAYADFITPFEGTISNVTDLIKNGLPENAQIQSFFILGCYWQPAFGVTGIANYVLPYDRIYVQGSKAGLYNTDVCVSYLVI